jgi:hypothetical protein
MIGALLGIAMASRANNQITVAIIGVAGVIAAALITNWSNIFGPKPAPDTIAIEYSTTCKFTVGPRAGTAFHFQPGTVIPAIVGSPCTDGAGSSGIAIKD